MTEAPGHSLGLLHWLRPHKLPVILQDESAECGLICLAMVAAFHGLPADSRAVRHRFPVSARGSQLPQLMTMGESLGFSVRAVKCELDGLSALKRPAVLHWCMNHFVVLDSVSRRGIVVHDPGCGRRRLSWGEVSKCFTGVALELTPGNGFGQGIVASQALRWTDLWSRISGLRRVLLHILLLSLVLQGATLLVPFTVRLVVDEVLGKQNDSLLLTAALGFAYLSVTAVVVETSRSFAVLSAGKLLGFQIAQNLLRHLLRLPLSFFEKRHIGDVASRFQSLEPIQRLLSSDLVQGLVDGAMASVTLGAMCLLSFQLTWVTVALTATYATASAFSTVAIRRELLESVSARAQETSHFLETLRSVQTVKLFGKELDRVGQWQARRADTINAEFRQGKWEVLHVTFQRVLAGAESLAVLVLGVGLVQRAELSLGSLFAFLAYKMAFTRSIVSLAEKSVEVAKARVHLERLRDIVQEPSEERLDGTFRPLDASFDGALAVRQLSFAYVGESKAVWEDLNFDVRAGEVVAIVGASGCGKTTLLKVLTGLLLPSHGRIALGKHRLLHQNVQPGEYRRHIGVVLQDDPLLSGSIADNVCFFDPKPDMELIVESCRLACIADDVEQMAMGYETLLGDMGSLLSGGQRQRLALARALYRRPKILFMDEGTSHLDVATEQRLNENLRALSMTRVFIAHRPDTILLADRVFSVEKRQFVDPISMLAEVASRDGSRTRLVGS